VFVSDPDDQPIATLTIVVTRDLDPLRRALMENIASGGSIKVTAVGPNVLLTGSVANISDMQRAVDLGKAFLVSGSAGDIINGLTVREKDQVMIKVTIAEVKRTILKQLGVNLTGMWQVANNAFGFTTNPSLPNSLGGQLNGVNNNRVGNIPGTTLPGATTPFGQLNAFESAGVTRVLAEPTLSAVSGESAEFLAGGEIPVQTSQITNGSATFSTVYQPYGVRLKFKPLVLGQGRISLGIATEVRDVDTSRPSVDGNPSFLTRSVSTVVELPSGGALVMAGLLQEGIQQAIQGIPGAMNLPVLGALFRSRNFQRNETELVISVVPYIAKPVMPDAIAYPSDGFVDSSDPQAIFLGQINQTYNSNAPVGMQQRKLPAYKGDVGFITTH
jgi:pilus assembly protein CpaC